MLNGSCYDHYAAQYVAKGLHPIVIGPNSKVPRHFVGGKYVNTPQWQARPVISPPQPGAGIGIRLGNGLVAIDLDHPEIAALIEQALPPTPCSKVGRPGRKTLFYRAPATLGTFCFRVGDIKVVEVLCGGAQTVLPPTVHPDTGKPYHWEGMSLLEVDLADLPLLSPDIDDHLEQIINEYVGTEKVETPHKHEGDADSPYRQLNELALKRYNLPKWVPSLGLHRLKRSRGFTPHYTCVATWRESTSGKSLDERDANLKITPKGIRDFGDGRGYTAIDLVMAALELELSEAVAWLDEKLGWSGGGPEIKQGPEGGGDSEGQTGETGNGKAGDEDTKHTTGKKKAEEPRRRFRLEAFDDIQVGTEPPYLIEELVPARGIVMLWGKKKSLKSFLLFGALFHVAKGWDFHGRTVKQGHVVYCAFEGGLGYSKRIEALRKEYAIDPVSEKTPMHLLRGGANLIAEHPKLVEEIRRTMEGTQPVVVALDTLNRSLHGSESKDVDMANYIRAAEAIRDAFDCVVIIVHHCGWDESRPRGHSSLGGAVDAELSVSREEELVTLTVEEMKDGPEGGQVIGRTKTWTIGIDDNGKEMTSLVIVPADESDQPAIKKRGRQKMTDRQVLALDLLNRCLGRHGTPLPPGLDIGETIGVHLSKWHEALTAANALGRHDDKEWQRIQQALQARNLIRIHVPWVWVPFPQRTED
jgi:hypothetical protein